MSRNILIHALLGLAATAMRRCDDAPQVRSQISPAVDVSEIVDALLADLAKTTSPEPTPQP